MLGSLETLGEKFGLPQLLSFLLFSNDPYLALNLIWSQLSGHKFPSKAGGIQPSAEANLQIFALPRYQQCKTWLSKPVSTEVASAHPQQLSPITADTWTLLRFGSWGSEVASLPRHCHSRTDRHQISIKQKWETVGTNLAPSSFPADFPNLGVCWDVCQEQGTGHSPAGMQLAAHFPSLGCCLLNGSGITLISLTVRMLEESFSCIWGKQQVSEDKMKRQNKVL